MKSVSVALFAGVLSCAFVQSVSAAEPAKYRERVLYSFGSLPDGAEPYASVIDVKGTLYGTTYGGGGSGNGTVFGLDLKTGKEKILYSFVDNSEGALLDVKGTLYGATTGGDNGAGTVFAIDPKTGALHYLYVFCRRQNCVDGAYPVAGLINVNGTLYGTTSGGGASGIQACNGFGCGTVFSLDPRTGNEKVLYSFCSQQNCADGSGPSAGLIDVGGMLYGTTENQSGTVFSIDPNTGVEKTLYTFCSQQNCADGANPHASLIDVNGMLYGTTEEGGIICGGQRCGTVFSIDPNTGAEKVLYSFGGGTDGANPLANLIDVKGTLYGTTFYGGGTGCGGLGCGTVYAFNPGTGAETVLHSFSGGPDGQAPRGGLIGVKDTLTGTDTLYGTTIVGGGGTGCGSGGCGTVYSLKKKP